jgi:hypothetical protein
MALTSRFYMAVAAEYTSPIDLGNPTSNTDWARQVVLASGTGAGQADLIFTDTRTLAASATEDLDLAGSLVGAFGATLTFVKVKAVAVAAAAGNTNNVVVGAASSNPWATLLNSTGTVTLRPGAFFVAVAGVADSTGYGVTASTGDLLKVANSAGSTGVSYDLIVIGTSA